MVKTKSNQEIFNEFITVFEKRKLPKNIDWDKLYYLQFEKDSSCTYHRLLELLHKGVNMGKIKCIKREELYHRN